MNKLVLFLIFINLNFLFSESIEERIFINSDKEVLNIGKKMYLLEDTETKLSIEDILKPEYQKLFKKSEQEVPTFNSSNGRVWVKFTVENKIEKEIFAEIGESLAWYIDFYKPDLNGKLILTTKTGMMRPIQNRELDTNFFLFELSKSKEQITYYFSIQSESTFLISLRLGTTKRIYEDSYPNILFLGMFSGFIIIMFFYNLFVYFSVRDNVYLYYCGYLFFGLFLNNFISGNYGYKWNPITYYSEYFMAPLFISSFFIVLFLIKLLQIGKKQLFFFITVGYLLLCFIFMIKNLITGSYIFIIDIFQISTLFIYIYIFQYSIFIYYKGNKSARFVVFGFSFYLMGIVIAVLQNFGILPTNFFTSASVVFGTSIEIMMFSLALADRINKIQKDKEEALLGKQNAQTELLLYLRENEKKISVQNQELITIQKELIIAKEKAEAGSKAKTEFLANMSHEIRTPLNAIIGFTDLLKNTELSSIQKQFVENANISGEALLGVINDILDFSKIEAGMMKLEIIKTDLISLFENCVDIVKFTADKKGIQLLKDIDSKIPRLGKVDPIRLKQILINLLSNAIKFTEKGEVELKVKYQELENTKGKLSFFVIDTGIGISTEQKEKLFKAFSQADSSTTRKFGGTGLGLIISDLIAKKFNSKIELESKQGNGTTFYFDLIIDFEKEENLNNQEINKNLDLNKEIQNDNYKTINKNFSNPTEPLKILIVDDVDINIKLLQSILKNFFPEAEILIGMNGKQAVDMFLGRNPDLIIMDIQMPVMDGLEATKTIRRYEDSLGKNVPIIALTAGAFKEEEEKCFAVGMNEFLTKPVNIPKIKTTIEKYIFKN